MSKVRSWLAKKSPEDCGLTLAQFLLRLLEAKQIEKYHKLLSNYDWLEAKINHPLFGVQSLIEDYKLIENRELSDHQEYNRETLKDLKLIKEALQLSAHILNQDKKELAGQLIGRLLYFKERITIQKLLQQIYQTPITFAISTNNTGKKSKFCQLRIYLHHHQQFSPQLQPWLFHHCWLHLFIVNRRANI